MVDTKTHNAEVSANDIKAISEAREAFNAAYSEYMRTRWELCRRLQIALDNEIGEHLPKPALNKPMPEPKLQKLLAVAEMLGLVK